MQLTVFFIYLTFLIALVELYVGRLAIDELERMWKVAVVDHLRYLPSISVERLDKITKLSE